MVENIRIAHNLKNDGYSIEQISEYIGVTIPTIKKYLSYSPQVYDDYKSAKRMDNIAVLLLLSPLLIPLIILIYMIMGKTAFFIIIIMLISIKYIPLIIKHYVIKNR